MAPSVTSKASAYSTTCRAGRVKAVSASTPDVDLNRVVAYPAWMTIRITPSNPAVRQRYETASRPFKLSEGESWATDPPLRKQNRNSIIRPQKTFLRRTSGTNAKVMAWMMNAYSMNHTAPPSPA